MSSKKRRGTKPSNDGEKAPEPALAKESAGFPLLCLRHVQPGFGVEDLPAEAQAEFLVKWSKRSKVSWNDLGTHQRHGLGSEKLPADKIRPMVPEKFAADSYQVYRHHGNLPFVGVRINDVFYVLWIEKKFGELYDHGSK